MIDHHHVYVYCTATSVTKRIKTIASTRAAVGGVLDVHV